MENLSWRMYNKANKETIIVKDRGRERKPGKGIPMPKI
jgi:hypothetical protein